MADTNNISYRFQISPHPRVSNAVSVFGKPSKEAADAVRSCVIKIINEIPIRVCFVYNNGITRDEQERNIAQLLNRISRFSLQERLLNEGVATQLCNLRDKVADTVVDSFVYSDVGSNDVSLAIDKFLERLPYETSGGPSISYPSTMHTAAALKDKIMPAATKIFNSVASQGRGGVA